MTDAAKKRTVAIFCGSKKGNDPLFAEHAARLGKMLAGSGFNIVYGGGDSGLMGMVANEALLNKGLTQLIITEDMHVRKKTMYDLADVAIILPGGIGTLDELFETLTWNQLSIHNKKTFILNSNGFYSALIDHMKRLEKNDFLYHPVSESFSVHQDPESLLDELVRG